MKKRLASLCLLFLTLSTGCKYLTDANENRAPANRRSTEQVPESFGTSTLLRFKNFFEVDVSKSSES